MDDKSIGVVEPVKLNRFMYRVRVYVDDDAVRTQLVYFETKVEAEQFVAGLPEATR